MKKRFVLLMWIAAAALAVFPEARKAADPDLGRDRLPCQTILSEWTAGSGPGRTLAAGLSSCPEAGFVPTWVNVGPKGAPVHLIETSPLDPKKLFVLVSQAVYRTLDGGLSWELWTYLPSEPHSDCPVDLAVDPADDRKIYYLNVPAGGQDYQCQLWRTLDRGAGWVQLPVPIYQGSIDVDSRAPNVLLASGIYGSEDVNNYVAFFKSIDRGLTWTETNVGTFRSYWGGWCKLFISPSQPEVMYLVGNAHNPHSVLYRTENAGSAWADVTPDPAGPPNPAFSMDPTNPLRIIMAGNYGSTWIFGSLDGGMSWTRTEMTDIALPKLLMPPSAPGVVESAGAILNASGQWIPAYLHSLDNGFTWTSVGPCPGTNDLKLAGGIRYVAGSGGLFRSYDRGSSWLPSTADIKGMPIHAVDVARSRPQTIYAAIGSFLSRSTDGGASWTPRPEFKAEWISAMDRICVSPADPDTLLIMGRVGSARGARHQMFKSRDAGTTWVNLMPYYYPSDFVQMPGAFEQLRAVARSSIDQLLFCRSDNGGENWSYQSVLQKTFGGREPAIAMDPVMLNTFYIGCGTDVFRSLDAGVTWTLHAPAAVIGEIGDLEIHPERTNILYAGTAFGFFRSGDGGMTWTQTGDFDVSDILVSARQPYPVFAGGAEGIFLSEDDGATWTSWNEGIEHLAVRDLALDVANSLLYAGTGHSLWRTPVPAVAVTYVISGTVRTGAGSPLAGVTVTFSGGAGTTTTASDGRYNLAVPAGWSGTVTPSLSGWSFTPSSRSFTNIGADQAGQDFTATGAALTISGAVRTAVGTGVSGVRMMGLPGNPSTDGSGGYGANVPTGWSGTVRPVKSGLAFDPVSRCYENVTTSQNVQNFAARDGGLVYDTSPSACQILPEVIWAAATGGGTWVTEIQLTDITGGSVVSAWFCPGGGVRRGPLVLWTGPGPDCSLTIGNILSRLREIDPGYAYEGKVGALELRTQDDAHRILAVARTVNGNYGKTFPGLNDAGSNAACVGMDLALPNLASTSSIRSFAGAFNPTDASVTVEFRIIGPSGGPIGSPFTRVFAGHDFQSFDVFAAAGAGGSYDNAWLRIRPVSGLGRILVFGATANNQTNDPAAHMAVPLWPGLEASPTSAVVLPEVIWATATGGGTWVSEVQVIDVTGGSSIQAWFTGTDGVRRGPVTIWGPGAAGACYRTGNFLQMLKGLDGFPYEEKVGAVELRTQDAGHTIIAAVRTVNGSYGKTFTGVSDSDAHTAAVGRSMVIQNLANDAANRFFAGVFNPTTAGIQIQFRLMDGQGGLIGSFKRALAGYGYMTFNPFEQAGRPYPADSYRNITLEVRPLSGSGRVFCFGASAFNASNDPAAHVPVQKR